MIGYQHLKRFASTYRHIQTI